MAKAPKQQEQQPEPIEADIDDRIPCDITIAQVDKARKHLLGRLRHLVLTNIFATGDPGQIARTVQDLKALDMLNPVLGNAVTPEKPKAPTVEEAAADQAAAHDRHKRDEDRKEASR